jgi:hypothetical protein
MDTDLIGRWLLILGAVVALIGLAFILLPRIPLIGRLPGDISIERDGFSFYFPLATALVISIILTIVINIVIRIVNR